MKIGLLSLQGAVTPHAEKLKALGVDVVDVLYPRDLEGLSGIVLPGGESTTMLHLLGLNSLWEPLQKFVQTKPSFGLCAGAILLARSVGHPTQASLNAIDLHIERNAYGRQIHSAIVPLPLTAEGKERFGVGEVEGVFIRAPRFGELGKKVMTLAEREKEPVMVESGLCLAATFHPELSNSNVIHQYFVQKCKQNN